MPIYEYRCEQCGHSLAKLQKLADAPLTDCPACQAPALNKLLSVPGFHFSGTAQQATNSKVGQMNQWPSCEAGGGCQGCPAGN